MYWKKLTKEQVARSSLSVIDTSTNENIILRQDFDLFEDGNRLNSLKNSKRNYSTLIINVIESKNDREIEIDELSRKGDMVSNDVNRIRKHKNNFKSIFKGCRCNRNKIDRGLVETISTLIHKYNIKCDLFFDGKLNWANCGRLMKHHIDIIDGSIYLCIEINKVILSDEKVCLVTNKYKTLLNETDEAYCCIR